MRIGPVWQTSIIRPIVISTPIYSNHAILDDTRFVSQQSTMLAWLFRTGQNGRMSSKPPLFATPSLPSWVLRISGTEHRATSGDYRTKMEGFGRTCGGRLGGAASCGGICVFLTDCTDPDLFFLA